MSQPRNKKIIKVAVVIIGCLLLAVLFFEISGFLFLKIFRLPLEICRPWTIFQYWMMYRDSNRSFIKAAILGCLLAPWLITAAVAIAIKIKAGKRSLHGDAAFASNTEVQKYGLINPPDGLDKTILVGKHNGRYLNYGGTEFVLLAAPTRSGKGVGVVIPNCLNYSDSLVILDIKGENFDITSGYRAAHGQEVYLFAPFDPEGKTHRYNPLEYISSNEVDRVGDIDAIATALYNSESNGDKFWSENAKDLFRGLCLYVLETPGIPKTLGQILRESSAAGLKDSLTKKLKDAQDAGHPYSNRCIEALNRVFSNSENTLSGIVSTFGTPLLGFANARVDLATSANDFDLRDVRRKKMSIYLKIEPNKLKEARVLVNLFFDQLLNLNTKKLPEQDKSLRYQCLVLLDEMTSIGRVPMISQAIAYMAGYNMRLLTIIQSMTQLASAYGKDDAETIRANHSLLIMYAPNPTQQSLANEYSEMLGTQTVKSKSTSKGKGSTSTSESDQRRSLLLPQEIKGIGDKKEIVVLNKGSAKPILCQKIRYYEDPNFECRQRWETPFVPVQDVETFTASLDERVNKVLATELTEEDSRKIAGVNELPEIPKELAETPDSDWSNEQIQNYVEASFTKIAANRFNLSAIQHAPKLDLSKQQLNQLPEKINGNKDDGETSEDLDKTISDLFDGVDIPTEEQEKEPAQEPEDISLQQPSFDPAPVNEEPSSSLDKKTEGPEKEDENLEAIFETPTDKPPASTPSASPKKKQTSPLKDIRNLYRRKKTQTTSGKFKRHFSTLK